MVNYDESVLLDRMIDGNRSRVMKKDSLDEIRDEKNVMASIYREIESESTKLHLDMRKYRRPRKKICWGRKFRNAMRRLDARCTRNKMYSETLRPFIKKCYLRLLTPSCNMLKMAKMTNEEFVDCMYNVFLEREPEKEGRTYNIELLTSGSVSRDDVLFAFQVERNKTKRPMRLRYFKISRLLYKKRWENV